MISITKCIDAQVAAVKAAASTFKTVEAHAAQLDNFALQILRGMQGTVVLEPFDLIEYRISPPTPGTDKTTRMQTIYVDHEFVHYIGDRNARKMQEAVYSVLDLIQTVIPVLNGQTISYTDPTTHQAYTFGPFSLGTVEPFAMANEWAIYQVPFTLRGTAI